MATVYNLFTNPSFITNTTGWDGYTVGIKTGLVATLATGTNSVTLTTGTTSGMEVGQQLTKTSGAGAFGNSGVVYVKAITNSTVFTVGLADTTAQNHATLGSITFTAGATATLSLDSTDPLYGTGYSAKITAVDSSPYIGILTNASYRAPVIAGDTYTFSAYVKVPVGQATSEFKLRAYFYASSTLVDYLDAAPQKISSFDGWVRLTFTFTALATATFMSGLVFRSSTTTVSTGYNFLVDALQFQTGSKATSLIYDQGQKNKLVDKALTNVYIDHLTGMKLKADIRLGDFVFNRIDEYGVVWVISNVQGWNNLPEVQMQNFDRGWGDGSFVSYGRYGAREITIEGSFLVQDVDTQLEKARERLIKAINLVKTENWLIMNETTPKGVKVRLSAAPDIATTNPRGRTDFSFTLIASDPIKYKWDDARDDGYKLATVNNNPDTYTTIRNEGNTPVPVIFEIIGPTTGPVSIFNKTSEDLLGVVSKLKNYVVNPVASVSVTDNVATITTSNATGVAFGDTVELINLIDIYEVDRAEIASASTVVLTMTEKHNFAINQRVYLVGLSGSPWSIPDGEYPITAVYSSSNNYKLTITKASAGLTTKADTDVSGVALSISTNVSAVSYTSSNNIATYTTSATHGYKVGDTVVVANTTPIYDGTYVIDDVPSTTSFVISLYPNLVRRVEKYSSTYNTATVYVNRSSITFPVLAGDYIYISSLGTEYDGTYKVSSVDSSSNATYTLVTYDKDIKVPQTTVADSTYATVQIQSLGADRSSTGLTGKAYLGNRYNGTYNVSGILIEQPTKFTVDANLGFDVPARTQATYNGVTATASPVANYEVRRYNEVLNIDTLNREIALNGEIGGYRSRLDTIVDWIYLQPGDNEINFTDKSKKFVASVSYNTSSNTATIVTKTNHYLQPNANVTLSGLNTINSNVFANATVTVSITNTQAFTFQPALSFGSNITSTEVTTGHIYEVSPSYLNIYYRSGWIG
jgi:hypothetical protein